MLNPQLLQIFALTLSCSLAYWWLMLRFKDNWDSEDAEERKNLAGLGMFEGRLVIRNEHNPRQPVMFFEDFYGLLPCRWAQEGARP